MINIYTVKWGFKYGPEYVNSIFDQCKKHVTSDFNFYCLTEHAIGIIDKEKNLDKILKILKSDKMKRILKACLWGNFQIDWRLFTYFKKDFYKKA